MSDIKAQNLISPQAADKLLNAHDGDLALLYLYICRTGCRDLEKAADRLCRTLRDMEAAEEKLRRKGLLDKPAQVNNPPVAPAPELPQYKAEEISIRSKEDPQFAVIVSEAIKVMGHSLSGNDLKTLFGIYDYLALPTEVILVLLNYCAELFEEKYGSSRRPSARAIEKEAYVWVNREIMSLEQADEYIRSQKERRSGIGRIKAVLGIHGRELSAAERRTFEAWLDMGFDEDAISIAYDRTTEHTGGFKLRYMNRILENWHESNIHTEAEINAKDPRRGSAPAPAESSGKSIDITILDKI